MKNRTVKLILNQKFVSWFIRFLCLHQLELVSSVIIKYSFSYDQLSILSTLLAVFNFTWFSCKRNNVISQCVCMHDSFLKWLRILVLSGNWTCDKNTPADSTRAYLSRSRRFNYHYPAKTALECRPLIVAIFHPRCKLRPEMRATRGRSESLANSLRPCPSAMHFSSFP